AMSLARRFASSDGGVGERRGASACVRRGGGRGALIGSSGTRSSFGLGGGEGGGISPARASSPSGCSSNIRHSRSISSNACNLAVSSERSRATASSTWFTAHPRPCEDAPPYPTLSGETFRGFDSRRLHQNPANHPFSLSLSGEISVASHAA